MKVSNISILSLLLFTFVFAYFAQAEAITIVSEHHHINVRNGHPDVVSIEKEAPFYIEGVAVGNVEKSGLSYELSSEAHAGNYTVGTHTQLYYGYAEAQSTYVLQSDAMNNTALHLNAYFSGDHFTEQYSRADLRNITTDDVLLTYDTHAPEYWPPGSDPDDFWNGFDFDYQFYFTFWPQDLYEFNLYTWSTGSDEGFSTTSLTAAFADGMHSVPEPATIFLLGIGLCGLGLRKNAVLYT